MQPPCAKRRRIDAVDEPIRNETETIHPEMAWSKEMNAIYNDPWNFEMNGVAAVEEKKGTKCIMCGSSGHLASSCPSACCLKCGDKTDSFEEECAKCVTETKTICEICGYRGHSKYNCPSLWKCYHSTIDMTSAPQHSTLENPRNFEFSLSGGGQAGGFY